jgi:D-amino peptidase
MKVLVADDMEGISGVVNWNQVDPAHPEYARFRRIMTADVNAAIGGAFAGGADEVIVADGHGGNCNLLIEELDARARFNAGGLPPFSMLQGIDTGVDAVMFVGYHARIGAPDAICGHTWSPSRLANLWLNGDIIGEIGMNAGLCGHFGAPVIMISGDQTACAEAVELLGPIETAVVKQAHGNMAADCLAPELAQQRIRAAAEQAMRRFQAGQSPPPWHPQAPIRIAIDFVQVEMAARAATIPGMRWAGDRRVEFTAADMPAAYSTFWAAVMLARS